MLVLSPPTFSCHLLGAFELIGFDVGNPHSALRVAFPVWASHTAVPWALFGFFASTILEMKRRLFISFLTLPDRATASTCNVLVWIRQKPSLQGESLLSRVWHTVRKRCSLWGTVVILQDPGFGLQRTGWILALTCNLSWVSLCNEWTS